jgi:tetratricopeptide (TPR) repeat protein
MFSASALAELGHFERALIAANDALAITHRLLPDNDPQVAEAEFRLAQVYGEANRLPEALAHATQSLHVLQAASEPNDERVADLLDMVGDIERELGRARRAAERHQTALGKRGKDSPDRWQSYGYLGEAELAAGERELARDHLQRSLGAASDTEPQLRASFALALLRVAPESARARELLQEAIKLPDAQGTRAHRLRLEAMRALHAHNAPKFKNETRAN